MVLYMTDVVECHVAQRDCWIVTDLADYVSMRLRNLSDDVREMTIVGTPQVDEIPPMAFLIMLGGNPVILFVTG